MKLLKKSSLIIGMALPMVLGGCDLGLTQNHEHVFDYDNAVWTWSDDLTSATVKFNCKDGDASTDPVAAEISVDDKQPTCTQGAVDTYTATAVVGGVTYTDTKTKTQEQIGHNFTSLEVTGYKSSYSAFETFDLTGVVVKKVCANDPTHKEEVDLAKVSIQYEHGSELHAGDTKVTIKAGELTGKATITVDKATPVITMAESVETTCHVLPTIAVSSTVGNPSVKVFKDGVEVTAAELVEGTYVIKATVAETSDIKAAEKTGTLIVSHNFNKEVVAEQFIKTQAGCETDAVYFKSCECGTKGSETFVAENTAIGHSFTSLEVSGSIKTAYSAFETFDSTGIVVEKVCARDGEHKEVVSEGISFEYENGNEFHAGDQNIIVKVGSLSKEVPVTVVKAVPQISGLEDTTTGCKTMPSFEGVTSSVGSVVTKVYTDNTFETEVSGESLTEGEYVIKAEVMGTDDIEAAQATAKLTVSHDHSFTVEKDVIGLKQGVCACGDETEKQTIVPEDIDFTASKYGASYCSIEEDNKKYETMPDYYMVISKDSIQYKLNNGIGSDVDYATRKFRISLPKINVSLFDSVSFNLVSWNNSGNINWTTSQMISLDEGFTNKISVPVEGPLNGKLFLVKNADGNGYNLVINAFGSTIYRALTTEEINGTQSVTFYANCHYARGLELNNFAIHSCNEHNWIKTVADTSRIIRDVNGFCPDCGAVKKFVNDGSDIDFLANAYDSTYYLGTDNNQSWKMSKTSDAIEYKLYSNPKDANTLFTIALPKVKFTDFTDVNFKLSAPNWTELNGFGFTAEEAQSGEKHTTYGGNKEGCSLKFGWESDKLVATLEFENLKMSTVVTDSSVISGDSNFKFYVRDIYDRSLFLNGIELFVEHSYGDPVVLNDKIGVTRQTCSHGHHSTETMPTIDFSANLYGANAYNYADSCDVNYLITKTADSITYKSYDLDKSFGFFLPKIKFTDFESVSFDILGSELTTRMGWGFSKEEAEGGTHKLSADGDASGKIVFEWKDGKLYAGIILGNISFVEEVTDQDIIKGNTSFGIYNTSHYNRFFKISNLQFNPGHLKGNAQADTTKISVAKSTCLICGEVLEQQLPTFDFTANRYGATFLKDDSDDQAWRWQSLGGITADAIEYKLYGNSMTEFALVLPKVDFNDFAEVKFNFTASNWYENNGFGFTKEEAEGGAHHTTYGGSKDGTLTFNWNDNKLLVTFKFEHVEMSTEISDTDVINGNNGFKLHVTDLYDRSITMTGIELQAK